MRIRTHNIRELDRIDMKILTVLQADARIPITELAERVGLSVMGMRASACSTVKIFMSMRSSSRILWVRIRMIFP